MDIQNARYLTVAMIPVAIYLATGPKLPTIPLIGISALDAGSVFQIFLFADLLAAATVMPVLLTLWNRISSQGALLGAVRGLLSVVAYGAVTGDLRDGIEYIFSPTNEFGLANLGRIPVSSNRLYNSYNCWLLADA